MQQDYHVAELGANTKKANAVINLVYFQRDMNKCRRFETIQHNKIY